MLAISGHKGLNTYRTDFGIMQIAHEDDGQELYEINLLGIKRAIRAMELLEPYNITPKLKHYDTTFMLTEDLRETDDFSLYSPDDWQDLRRELVKRLLIMRKVGIRHGDLNGNNIIVKNKIPYFIDWQEAHMIDEPPPQVSPYPDTHFILQDMIRWVGNPNISDPYRVCRRWAEIYGDFNTGLDFPMEGKTLLDIGCFQGDFCAFASAEKMNVAGIDIGNFRHDEDSIDIARKLWDGFNIIFLKADVIELKTFKYDVVLFMDTFPHIIKQHGRKRTLKLLQQVIKEAGVVYFETQINGDKTGIEWLNSDEDIINLYPEADWHKLVVIPEAGFPRTLWRVKNGLN